MGHEDFHESDEHDDVENSSEFDEPLQHGGEPHSTEDDDDVEDAPESESSLHDGSELHSHDEAWEYFSACFDENRTEARGRARSGWPSYWVGNLEDADVIVHAAIFSLARRTEPHHLDPDKETFRRDGPGLLYRQIAYTKSSEIRRRAGWYGRIATPTTDEDGHFIDPVDGLSYVFSEPHDLAETGQLTDDGFDPDVELLELRLLAACGPRIRERLRSISDDQRTALRTKLEVKSGLRPKGDNAPDLDRQHLSRARKALAKEILAAAAEIDLPPTSADLGYTFTDDIVLRLLDLGHIGWHDLR